MAVGKNDLPSGSTRDSRFDDLRREVRPMAIKSLAVIVLLVLFAVILALLLVPSHSWAAALEWFMNPPQSSPCGCIYQSGSNG